MVNACLRNIKRLNGRLNAIVSQPNQPIYREPSAITAINTQRPLEGCAVAVKDLFCTEELTTTTCSSLMLRDFRAGYNATVVELLLESGASLIGKTNMDEFGMGSHGVHSVHGPVINPRYADEDRSAGGSSSGSAAAVAAGFCHLALASDTGGSTRLPAAYCGVLGFKPSYGRLSRYGLIAYASSLDTVGLITRDIATMRRAFQCLDLHDPCDPTSLRAERRKQLKELENAATTKQLVIGVPDDYCPQELSGDGRLAQFNCLLERLAKVNGIRLQPVSLPHSRFSTAAYYLIASAEASSNLARYDGIRYGHRSKRDPIFNCGDKTSFSREQVSQAISYTRDEGFGREVKRRILLGNYVLSAEQYDRFFAQAQRVRRLVQGDFNHVFRVPHLDCVLSGSTDDGDDANVKVDILITPVRTEGKPPLISDLISANDSNQSRSATETYLTDIFTTPPSLAGLPCISLPFGDTSAQLIGQYGCDQTVLTAAERLINECISL